MKKLLFLVSLIGSALVNGQIITTIAGDGIQGFSGDGGQAIAAEIFLPYGVNLDVSGNIYISDTYNSRIRMVNASGVITTVAGGGSTLGDGGPATVAHLANPQQVAFDATGNIYIADYGNNRIRKVNTSGIITTIAGNGTLGYSGDGAQATLAELHYPSGVTLDASGNIYIADQNNARIRKIDNSGIITTIAGNGTQGFSGDGGLATSAELNYPNEIAVDALGNIYIADSYNNRVRMINTSGIITTFAGNGSAGFNGDGGGATAAQLSSPQGVMIDASGNLYIADKGNNRIRMVNTSGIITTIAGNGTAGFTGDGGLATSGEIYGPSAIDFDASGNMYIADSYNHRIRKVTTVVGINQFSANTQISIYPNPTSDQFFIETNTTDKLTVDLYDINGRHVFSKSVNDKPVINTTSLNEGVYTMTIKSVDHVTNKKLVIVR